MFKITPNPSFTIPVQLTIPGQDEKQSITVTFKYLKKDEFMKWQKDHADSPHEKSLQDVIEGWSGIYDDQEKELPYSAKNLQLLCSNYYKAGREIVEAFMAETIGARIKN